MTTDVRERSRGILRAEMAAVASDFCVERGFEHVTVDDLVQRIGVSRATFFRYFASKEDAIVSALRDEHDSIADRIRLEARRGAAAFAVVRGALEPTVVASRSNPARLRGRVAMIVANPSLRARLALDRADQRESLAEALGPFVADRRTALVVAMAATAAIELGWSLWTDEESSDLGDEFDTAFELVAGVSRVTILASATTEAL